MDKIDEQRAESMITVARASLLIGLASGRGSRPPAPSGRTRRLPLRPRVMVMAITLFALLSAMPSASVAHIIRAEKQFSDIGRSDARYDIGFLVVVGIIPGTPRFEPDKPLAKRDLAAWVAMSKTSGAEDRKPDVDALAGSTLAARGIDTLEGAATFGDIARVFFNNQVIPERGDEIPTKAAAARFLVRHLSARMNGSTLLEAAGLKAGPAGKVSDVQIKATGAGGKVFWVTIGDVVLPMYAHGRIGAGPADLAQWKGRSVGRSLIRTVGGRDMWMYLEAAELF